MRLSLRIVWALLRVGLAYVAIWLLWVTWWIGFCVGATGSATCIGSYVGRDQLADFIQRQGLKRPSVSESTLW